MFIPDVFPADRVHFQTHSVLVLSADAAVLKDLEVTRVLNVTTDSDIADPEVFKSSLSTRVILGMSDVRSRFVYGENILRLEMANGDGSGDPAFGERRIVLQDHSIGMTGLSGHTLSGYSAGQVDSLTAPIQAGVGGVLTTGFVASVYQ